MPKHIAGGDHCVDCEQFFIGCSIRHTIEKDETYSIIDKALEELFPGKEVEYVLYSFISKCNNFKKRSKLTLEDVLEKVLNGEELTEEERAIADEVLK